MIKIPKTVLHDPGKALSREWLVTNGIGGYASSSIVGANTRRYHGLLVASFPPPVERQVLLSKVDEELTVDGKTYSLGTNEYRDGTIHPQGFRSITSFRLELGIPTWEFSAGGVRLVKQVWMEQGRNTVYLLYRLIESPGTVRLSVRPFCAFRGYHSVGNCRLQITDCRVGEGAVSLTHHESRISLDLSSSGAFHPSPDTYRSFLYRMERERGFSDCVEDLYTPGEFLAEMEQGDAFGICAMADAYPPLPMREWARERGLPAKDDTPLPDPPPQGGRESLSRYIVQAYEREIGRRQSLVGDETDSLRRSLLLAADQFVVAPPSMSTDTPVLPDSHTQTRTTINAGYPWFTDWGRDTMISFPGILLCTGRFREAREILVAHAECVADGLIPNRITDNGNAEYNTVDASLWYFEALSRYVRASGDCDIVNTLFPALESIIERHMQGTRYGIHMCSDGLLHAGVEGSQLTWMDARVDGVPITPRIGKPVEINALWYNALCLMCSWAMRADKSALPYEIAAARCLTSFGRRFPYEDGGYLHDVIDSPEGDDPSLRPNQIIAVSLPNSPLDCRRQKSVVDAVARHLLAPYGLRTLSPDDARYCGHYFGGPSERDSAYHQGTVWPWLLGHFAEAHYRVYRDRRYIRRLLTHFREHLKEAGVGSISEVFDGDPPFRPGGCIAQAWSVTELLRISDL